MPRSYVRQIPMNELGQTVPGPMAWFWRRRLADVHDWVGAEPAERLEAPRTSIRAGELSPRPASFLETFRHG
jgi:hypothetical protein